MSCGDQCHVCRAAVPDTVSLHCGHSLCPACISAFAGLCGAGGALPCPSCGKAGPLPASDGSPDLSASSSIKCGPCEEPEGARECLTCGFALCAQCVETHQRPAYRHHEVAELGSLAKRRKLCDVRTCKEHEEEAKLYCQQCESLVCVICVRGRHNVHPCPPVTDAAKTFPHKDRLVSCFQEALAEVQRVDQLLVTAIDEGAAQVKDNVHQCQQALQAYLQQLEADATAKADGVLRQRVALTAIRRRLLQGLALADTAVDPVDLIHLTLYAKSVARDVTRSLVSVPAVGRLAAAELLQALPRPAAGDGAIHKLALRGLAALVHDVYEFSPETPDASFSPDKRRAGSSKVVTAMATNGFSNGVHQWQMRVIGVTPSLLVGVAPIETPLTGSIGGRHGYFLNTANGRIVSPSPNSAVSWTVVSQQYCHAVKTGTVLLLRLDMDHRTLSFAVDGKDSGVAFRDLPDGPLYPAVSFLGVGSQWVEFVDDAAPSYSLLGLPGGQPGGPADA
eukprot:EG_transcript_8233